MLRKEIEKALDVAELAGTNVILTTTQVKWLLNKIDYWQGWLEIISNNTIVALEKEKEGD